MAVEIDFTNSQADEHECKCEATTNGSTCD